MSKDLNKCMFIGRLGKDVELKSMPNGNAVANFSIACGDDYKDKQGQKVEQTNWINIVMFGRVAEIAGQYIRKGSKVYIEGKQRTRKWQDQSGKDCYATEVVASEMQMLDSKPEGQQQNNQQGYQSQSYQKQQQPQQNNQQQNIPPIQPHNETFDDDIPF